MNILPNREQLYAHSYAHILIVFLHHVLVYLEQSVDEAPFGFVSEESHAVSWIDIPDDIEERYSDYLHQRVSKKSGLYGIWMQIKTHQSNQDVVLLTLFLKRKKLPFSVIVPVSQPHMWWVEA